MQRGKKTIYQSSFTHRASNSSKPLADQTVGQRWAAWAVLAGEIEPWLIWPGPGEEKELAQEAIVLGRGRYHGTTVRYLSTNSPFSEEFCAIKTM